MFVGFDEILDFNREITITLDGGIMKNKITCTIIITICVFFMAGCGSNENPGAKTVGQNIYAGEYVSSSWHNDTLAQFRVNQNGELSGYLIVMYGYAYEMIGSIFSPGTLTLSIKDPTTHQPVPGSTSTGSCDGTGTCIGTTNAGPNETFQYVLKRVTPETNKYYGVFKGTLERSDSWPNGVCWFGIDYNGHIYGFADGFPPVSSTSFSGETNMSTGEITLKSASWSQDNATITGKIDAYGKIENGTWQDITSSGVFTGSILPIH